MASIAGNDLRKIINWSLTVDVLLEGEVGVCYQKRNCVGVQACVVCGIHMRTHGHAYEVCSSAAALLVQDGKCGVACAQSNTCGGEAVMTMAKDGRSVRLSARRALIECFRRSAPVCHPKGVRHAREMPCIAWNLSHPRAQLISLPFHFHHILSGNG